MLVEMTIGCSTDLQMCARAHRLVKRVLPKAGDKLFP
jgi:hypothetical protein